MGGGTAVVGVLTVVAVVQVGSLFSSDAWNNVTFTAGEMRNPKRNLPLSLAIGTGAVLPAVYRLQLCLPERAADVRRGMTWAGASCCLQDRVATAVMEVAFGAVGAKLMAAAILVSTFGCVNGLVLAGARVYYAMSQDGLFFKSDGKLDSKGVPMNSLWMQCAWTCLLCLSGQYGNLLDYVILAVLVFYVLTILGVVRAAAETAGGGAAVQGVRVSGAAGLYIVMAVWICGVLLRYKPQYTWPGLILVLLGVPVYMVWRRLGSREQGLEIRD